ncbi:MAG TPA: metallophosphoesterase [Terriglobales bacterium]|nr:metallophosphoesterase [Terriglobales bacterium]
MPLITRRKFLQATAAVATTGAFAIGADATILEPNDPQLVRVEIPLTRLPRSFDGFTIAQLSDFHYDEVFSVIPIRKAVKRVNDLHPDLIVLTGDFVTVPMPDDFLPEKSANRYTVKEAIRTAAPCAKLLHRLRARLGVFAILGNHDVFSAPDFITKCLSDRGIPVLRNSSIPIEVGKARFWLAGIDDVMQGTPDLNGALNSIPKDEAVVLLSHEPDFADEASHHPIDLQLSGHSHGGQIWLPIIGAPWLPPFARKYPRGKYQIGGLTLYTNIGLGTIRIPMRLNCTPEITLFTLRTGRSS